ncbi:MAG: hypothetical protein IJR72_06155 [Oscillospiraceae bacterium]|nr:hypothetical protein [Oscillospiraceae bacterium]
MGLFDGLKLAADLVKGGIAAYKAWEKLEALIKRSQDKYKSLVNANEAALYQEFVNLDYAKSKETETDKQNAMTDKVEAAGVAYLTALAADASFPQAFRTEITQAVAEYVKTNDMPMDIFAEHMMKQAKTPEEKAEVQKIIDEMKAEEAAKK